MVKLVAVGDVAFSGPLSIDPLVVAESIEPGLKTVLNSGIVLANLECVLYDGARWGRKGRGPCPMYSPTHVVDALSKMGVRIVSLANNHILDFGREGVESTVRTLEDAGIAHFGAGLNYAQACRPAMLHIGGISLGFLGFAQSQFPTRKREGTIPVDHPHAQRLVTRWAKKCDFLVVCIHEGIEGLGYPMRSTVKAAARFAKAGAGLVLGTHPHCIQGMQRYGSVRIFYSLGNFLMPMLQQDLYSHWLKQTDLTLMGVGIEKQHIAEAIVLDIQIAGRSQCITQPFPIILSESGVPKLASGETGDQILQRLANLSDALDDPCAGAWKMRDDIERRYRRIGANSISWSHLLKNIGRIRPRHLKSYLRDRFS